jgi:hypothetical protein
MKDIDRNINSPLYEQAKIYHVNNIAPEILVNFKDVFTETINNGGVYTADIQPGEYYYRHILEQVESDNSFFFITLCVKSFEYPFYSYYAQSPLTASYTVIPYHFIVDSPITIKIIVRNINAENSKIKSSIQIKKKVK